MNGPEYVLLAGTVVVLFGFAWALTKAQRAGQP